jgi:hypothetical protein
VRSGTGGILAGDESLRAGQGTGQGNGKGNAQACDRGDAPALCAIVSSTSYPAGREGKPLPVSGPKPTGSSLPQPMSTNPEKGIGEHHEHQN